jgi:hypothetical protein
MSSRPAPVPSGNLSRKLTVARPHHARSLPRLGLAGGPRTIAAFRAGRGRLGGTLVLACEAECRTLPPTRRSPW